MGRLYIRYEANLWRYLVDSGVLEQLTFDGPYRGDYGNIYDNAEISPDGAVLAYTKGENMLHDRFHQRLTHDMTAYGKFIKWNGIGRQFFTALGDYDLPACRKPGRPGLAEL
jgi:hypothetical protein